MSDLKVVLQDLKEDSESGKLRAPQAAHGGLAAADRRPLFWIGAGRGRRRRGGRFCASSSRPAAPPVLPEYEITRLTFDSGIA